MKERAQLRPSEADLVSRLQRQARALRVLSSCNRALVRAHDLDELMQEVCAIAVEAGYQLAWIGRREGNAVRPVARAGRGEQDLAYVDTVQAATQDDPRGQGPTGTAIRTCKPVVAKRMATDESFAPWREAALSRGYASGLAVPLLQDGEAWGMLAVYSNEADAFADEEVTLLQDVGAALSYGVCLVQERNLRREAEAKKSAAVQALQESEERFRRLVDSSIEGVALHQLVRDCDGRVIDYRILDVNPAFETHTSVAAALARGALASELYGAGEAPYLVQYARVVETGKPRRFEVRFDPLGRDFRITAFPTGRDGFATVFEDITQSKREELASRLNEARLAALHELSQREFGSEQEVVDFGLDKAVQPTGSEIGCFHFVGGPGAMAAERCVASIERNPESAETQMLAECVRLRQPVVHNEWAAAGARTEGNSAVVRCMSACVLDQGAVVLVAGVANKKSAYEDHDVRQLQLFLEGVWSVIARWQARAALRASADRWRATFDAIPDAVCVVSPDHRFVNINEAGVRMLGLPPDEIIGRDCHALMHGTNAPIPGCPCTRTAASGQMTTFEFERGDRVFDTATWPLRGLNGTYNGCVQVIRDVTEARESETQRILLEEQLRASQRLEAVGKLAGGIAHDFNNLLSIIINYTQFAIEPLGPEDPLRADLDEILRASRRAAALTRQMLAFSRKQVLQPEVVHLNSVLLQMKEMLQRVIGEDIELLTALEPELQLIKADPGQLEQVVMNIVLNARDAMPDGGKLMIETSNVELDEAYSCAHMAVIPGPYVMLAFTDTGVGMDAETRSKVFEPFFTTKGVGRGTGLGLSTVYGIVKQSGGNIWVYSEMGRGTTFKLSFPVAQDVRRSAHPVEAQPPATGTETVLVVEDEEAVRMIVRRILRRAGYTVLAASDGREALLLCERYPGAVHLLLTDVVMPQMSGRELADQLSEVRPRTKVMYMSGYTDRAIVHHGAIEAGTNFISKPFSWEELARKVREALDGPEPGRSE